MGRSQNRTTGNSFPCNGRLIRFYRERKRLTQAELAQRAGYSVRLIGKAEAGKSVKFETIEILAEALSDETNLLKPFDLISAPVTLAEKYVQELFEHQENVVSAIQHFLADDFELYCLSNDDSFSLEGSYCGRAGLAQYASELFEMITVPEGLNVGSCCDLFPVDDDVVVWYRFQFLLKPSVDASSVDAAKTNATGALSLTTKLRFEDGLLKFQEDRIVLQ